MKDKTISEIVEEFGKEFDELGLKPPKGSMTGLERELIKDYFRKALQSYGNQREEAVREEIFVQLQKVADLNDCAEKEGYIESSVIYEFLSTIREKKED